MPKKKSENQDIEELKEKFGYNILDYNIISNKVLEGSFLSSGSRSFNNILTGDTEIGWVKGRIYELYGAEASGKTTIGQSAIVDCQKKKGRAMFIDAEKSFNPFLTCLSSTENVSFDSRSFSDSPTQKIGVN